MQALKYAAVLLVGIVLGAVGYWLLHKCDCGELVGRTSVTTITRDTIRPEVPRPVKEREVTRLKIKPAKARTFNGGVTTHAEVDSLNAGSADVTIDEAGVVEIPVTQKEYATDDYTAWVSGYKPALDSINIYRQVINTTTTETRYKSPRWSITVGPGVHYDGHRVQPMYIGVTAGFVILSK